MVKHPQEYWVHYRAFWLKADKADLNNLLIYIYENTNKNRNIQAL